MGISSPSRRTRILFRRQVYDSVSPIAISMGLGMGARVASSRIRRTSADGPVGRFLPRPAGHFFRDQD